MEDSRIAIFGNSGSGKTSLALHFEQQYELPRLDLDEIAWGNDWAKRRPLNESITALQKFNNDHQGWIIEGCYSDLLEAILPSCTELHFLNPGIDACVANCRKRHLDWETHRRPEDQRSPLDELLPWVREYETRHDEFSLTRHRALFDQFEGKKIEYRELPPL